MNNIEIFNNPDFGSIRTITENGVTLFCGSDIAKALGYARPSEAVSKHCKGTLKRRTPTTGGMQEILFILEGDVYRLIAHSKLPSAEKFEHWVFDDVLPSIRKHGGYLTPEMVEEALLNPDTIIRLATELKAERTKRKELETQVSVKDQQIAEMQPKAGYYDLVLQCKDAVAISKIAKDFGLSAIALNKILHEEKVQYKQGDVWLLYQKYAGMGYTQTKTELFPDGNGIQHARVRTCWTQKGRLFIYELLKSKGILPMIER